MLQFHIVFMTGEKLRQYIQGKWERGSYGPAPESEVGQIVMAILTAGHQLIYHVFLSASIYTRHH